MSNAIKYIKALEAAGIHRNHAEAQVQVILDALEGDLVTKNDFAIFSKHLENRFEHIDHRFELLRSEIRESELRLITRLGFLVVSSSTIAVAVLSWLIKMH